jgi:transposase-like protein
MLVLRRRDTRAALRLMRKLLKKKGFMPKSLVTDKLRSYHAILSLDRRFGSSEPKPPTTGKSRSRHRDCSLRF